MATTVRRLAALFIATLALSATGSAMRAPAPATKAASRVLHSRVGVATYYARTLDRRKTAGGGRFDNDSLVAAHPTYPFGTVVRVTNLTNRRSVRVRIVDRGPARGPRSTGVVIDLSRAAARRLGFLKAGRTRVRLEVLRWGERSVTR